MRIQPNPLVQVTGTGSCVGGRVLTNEDLEPLVKGYDTERSGPFGAWVDQVTHIHERPYCRPDERTSDMALVAARRALETARVDPADLDLIVYATFTPSHLIPGDHCALAQDLGALRCGTFQLMGACAGSVYGLGLAYGMVASGAAKHVLVIGAEQISPVLNYHDPLTAILFADGAGAALVSRVEGAEPGTGMLPPHLGFEFSPQAIRLGNANNPHDLRSFPPCETRPSHPLVERALIEMSGGPSVLRSAVNAMTECVARALGYRTADLKAGDPGLRAALDATRLVPHQANGRILDSLAVRLGLPPSRVVRTVYRYGNMSAASNLVALDFGVREGNMNRVLGPDERVLEVRTSSEDRIRKGDLVVLPSIGGGYLMGCVAFRQAFDGVPAAA